MAVKPNEIQSIDQVDTEYTKRAETFIQSITDLKVSFNEYNARISSFFDRLEVVEKKLENSVSEVNKISLCFSDKIRTVQNTMFAGVTNRIDELVSDVALKFEDSFDKCDKYIAYLKKAAQDTHENNARKHKFKKFYDISKAALVWILVILGTLFLLQYFLLK